eukprot:TRINITY_DN14417_c0_g1_i1.p1 TRINITY_DN14417_c0_g1~~TRINITY_DN14417_c0_g1_i1.p1  ORF type:complete len:622 (+),score=96.88 TRINITY_DN14417_c0_g1_i1:110-1867(+)
MPGRTSRPVSSLGALSGDETVWCMAWLEPADVARVLPLSRSVHGLLSAQDVLWENLVRQRAGHSEDRLQQLRGDCSSWRGVLQKLVCCFVHHRARCLGCSKYPIDGPCYTCMHCYGYNMVLCDECERSGSTARWHPMQHSLVKWPVPQPSNQISHVFSRQTSLQIREQPCAGYLDLPWVRKKPLYGALDNCPELYTCSACGIDVSSCTGLQTLPVAFRCLDCPGSTVLCASCALPEDVARLPVAAREQVPLRHQDLVAVLRYLAVQEEQDRRSVQSPHGRESESESSSTTTESSSSSDRMSESAMAGDGGVTAYAAAAGPAQAPPPDRGPDRTGDAVLQEIFDRAAQRAAPAPPEHRGWHRLCAMTVMPFPVAKPAAEQSYFLRSWVCDSCDRGNPCTVRFRCAVCRDFDFCAECEHKCQHQGVVGGVGRPFAGQGHRATHPMMMLRYPEARSTVELGPRARVLQMLTEDVQGRGDEDSEDSVSCAHGELCPPALAVPTRSEIERRNADALVGPGGSLQQAIAHLDAEAQAMFAERRAGGAAAAAADPGEDCSDAPPEGMHTPISYDDEDREDGADEDDDDGPGW